jgi:DNA-binding GntR family transcriptional regulator
MLYAQSERYRRLSVPAESKRRDLDAEHRALMEAALDRDANRATRLITEHLNLTTEVLKQFFDKSGGKSRENAKKERMAI